MGANSGPAPTATPARGGGSFLTKYFLVILFSFACLSLALNNRFTHIVVEDASVIESYLKESVQDLVTGQKRLPIDSSHMADDAAVSVGIEDNVVNANSKQKGPSNPHSQRVADLDCSRFGGPSKEAAAESVYWVSKIDSRPRLCRPHSFSDAIG